MAAASLASPGAASSADPAPLLGTRNGGRRSGRGWGLLHTARFLRRASGRHMMREPSMMVRETAAAHLEERQSDWAYSKPVVLLDILWNLAFVGVGVGVLVKSNDETPSMPLRLWIVGYALQCILHMVCVCIEYRRRQIPEGAHLDEEEGGSGRTSNSNSPNAIGEAADDEQGEQGGSTSASASGVMITILDQHMELTNKHPPFLVLTHDFTVEGEDTDRALGDSFVWLCIVFLAFDVFFVVFCVALACVIGIAVCCCLPCIIAILYAVADQEGASEEDICQLPKYKFRKIEDSEKLDELSGRFSGIMTECGSDPPVEHALSAEDAVSFQA
ncbi:hypothetical protein ZIOFF_038949 [Zingiber officinale]|uniref:RING-type E3 ubiquitin transferase n=1 Tax=Zingiber officinale TaxID=94328 RepID=A0A8J5KT40_ZINOF|nr:hypothetical protein ZIOFF_038949 [Zingiber officinale]